MTFNPDQSQLNALKTWNDKGDSIRHAVLGLTGEAGELIELFKKHEYKPGFSWWSCKVCGKSIDNRAKSLNSESIIYSAKYFHTTNGCLNYTPLILDELGDYSYYLRILAYQKEVSFEELCKIEWEYDGDMLWLLGQLASDSTYLLTEWIEHKGISKDILYFCTRNFLAILSKLDTTLDVVLDLNYKKLNSEPSNHGWRSAKMKTIDDCPPMNPK